jgi:hypothetical protein
MNKRMYFREIEIDGLPNPIYTYLIGIYTEEYAPLLAKSSSLEDYLQLLDNKFPDLQIHNLINGMDELSKSEIMEIEAVYQERKNSLVGTRRGLPEEYKLKPIKNLRKSKDVQSEYKKAIKSVSSNSNWNEISNGTERDREYYFKLRSKKSKTPKLNPDSTSKKKEQFSQYLSKRLAISLVEANHISKVVASYYKDRF